MRPICNWVPTDVIYSHKLTREGKCVACPDYERSSPEDDYLTCKNPEYQPDCNSKTYLTKHGQCKDCPAGEGGNWDDVKEKGQKCIKHDCAWNEYTKDDGNCEKCSDG